MEAKQSQTSIDHHFLFTCQLIPQTGIPLIQTQDEKTSLLVTKQTNLWRKIPEYGFSAQKMQSEFSLENNWGNWPIDSNLTPNEPISDIMFANSEENFQNDPLELLLTTEETSLITTSLTTASTTTNINIESSKNQNILMKVLEGIRLWPTLFPKRKLESVRIYATQLPNQKPIIANTAVYMEIRHANEMPFGNKINGPVQIGENISLVIRSRSHNSKSDTYNFFVHSCYASDKQGLEKLMLIDRFGCTVQPKLTGQMIRMKSAEQTYYYFWVSAFKFPGPDDVYFTCAVDISQNKSFPEGCGKEENESRRRRAFNGDINYIKLCNKAIVLINNEIN
uniref:ZP domain-containing protein n=1 Tax=Wuchereria bancrofti TaxID=6293 RepID=A0A1I8ES28_WUCBA